jgi:serine/threonine protein kinase
MAPELLKGLSSNTDASDVYAFGILVYEMFSGEEPYDGEDPGEVLRLVCDKAVNKRPQMPKYCPAQISSLMRDCVVYSPEERPTFVELDKRVKRVEEKDVLQSSQEVVRMGRDKFPNHIAKALQNDQKTGPEQHDMVTIMKSDIVDFETLSVSLEARKVASMLRRLYDKLDALTRKHDVFKLEVSENGWLFFIVLVCSLSLTVFCEPKLDLDDWRFLHGRG